MKLLNLIPKAKVLRWSDQKEHAFLKEMFKIEGVFDFWENQKQLANAMFVKTENRDWKGVSQFSTEMINTLEALKPQEEERTDSGGGYKSTQE